MLMFMSRMRPCDAHPCSNLETGEVFPRDSVQDAARSQTVAPALQAEQRQGGGGGGGGGAAADGTVGNDDDDLSELLLLLCPGLRHPKAYPF